MKSLKLKFFQYCLLTLGLSWLSGCSDIYEIPETVYLIKKGEHSSRVEGSLMGNGLRSMKTERLTFTVRFDETAIYDLGGNDQYDVNKLMGFSDCNSHHQKNSARFGWAYNLETGRVDIYAYLYNQGNRQIEKLGSVAIYETKEYGLSVDDTHFQFVFDGMEKRFERGSDCSTGVYYLLFPYFGGNKTAPHDIRLYIQEQP